MSSIYTLSIPVFDAEKFGSTVPDYTFKCHHTTATTNTKNGLLADPLLRYIIFGAGGMIVFLICLISIVCLGICFFSIKGRRKRTILVYFASKQTLHTSGKVSALMYY